MDAALKTFRNGTHRTRAPADTVARLEPLLETVGITRVADVTGLDRIGIPVVMVCRPNARSLAVSQGKGLDLDSARASGLMEAFETWHAERITLDLKLGCFNDLAGRYPLADIERLPQIRESGYHEDLPLLWIEGRVSGTGESLWLPYEMVHCNYTIPRPTGHGCFHASTNGLASGNHLLEATCHAICEVIERDSTTLWHRLDRHRRAANRIALETVDDADCRKLLEAFERAELTVAVWSTTTEVGVAS